MSESSPVAIVTGGSRGIGRAVVEVLASRGHRVYFCSRRSESVDAAEKDLRDAGLDDVHGEVVDVRRSEEVHRFVARVLDESARVDVLVNNAGVGHFDPVDEIEPGTWDRVLETNLSGSFYFLHAVAPSMRKRQSGWIVHVVSLAGRHPFAGGAVYNASKFGLLGLSDAAMLDLRSDGVRVSAILPGSVDTEFRSGGSGESWRLAPEDVARAITDLLDYPPRALPSRIELRPTKTGG